MNILAIDTTEAACSVALWLDGYCDEEFVIAPKLHNQIVFTMLDTLFARNTITIKQCDAIAFTRGPGSFTGIRIAAALSYGCATAADLPLIPISSLQALAYQAQRLYHATRVLAALDARMAETYWAIYHEAEDGEMLLNGCEQLGVCLRERLIAPASISCAIGSAWQADPAPVQPAYITSIHAVDVARAAYYDYGRGKLLTPEQAEPVYLRNNVVGTKNG